jgi:hypothetical protein
LAAKDAGIPSILIANFSLDPLLFVYAYTRRSPTFSSHRLSSNHLGPIHRRSYSLLGTCSPCGTNLLWISLCRSLGLASQYLLSLFNHHFLPLNGLTSSPNKHGLTSLMTWHVFQLRLREKGSNAQWCRRPCLSGLRGMKAQYYC